MVSLGFEKCPVEPAVYKRCLGASVLLVGVYVDDLVITRERTGEINSFKSQMKQMFSMCALGLLAYYLRVEVKQ